MQKYITEIESKLSSLPVEQKQSRLNLPEYIGRGQSKLQYIGIPTPSLHKTMQAGFSFSQKNKNELADIWNYVWWNSNCYETMWLALYWFYQPHQRIYLLNYWPFLKKWSQKIDNWAHSDILSGLYSRMLEDHEALIYPTLTKWNRSKNPWIRRISIISLIYYSRQRKKIIDLDKILPLVETQLDYEHYYVQKAVGWTLREAYNVYPNSIMEFIKNHLNKISSPAFLTATEKMPKYDRDDLIKIRRKNSN